MRKKPMLPAHLAKEMQDFRKDRFGLAQWQKTLEILEEHSENRQVVLDRLASGSIISANSFDLTLLDHGRVFHLDQIREICLRYRLRFLDSGVFRGEIPSEAVNRIQQLQRVHGIEMGGFKLAAPASAFTLKNVNDPLLFAPIDGDYYYLVHQWGKDLSRFRKLLTWPVRNLMNFTVFCVILSLTFAMLLPTGTLDRRIPMAKIIVFLFTFKSVFAVLAYSFFILGKRFSASAWDSPYFNA